MNKHSFLSTILGLGRCNELKRIAAFVVIIGSVIWGLLLLLGHFFYVGVINFFVSITFGWSLGGIIYLLGWLILLDIQVKDKGIKDAAYQWTKVWGIVLIIALFALGLYSNRYRKDYAIACSYALVDDTDGVYHIFSCESSQNDHAMYRAKAYKVRNTHKLCEECEEIFEDKLIFEAENTYQ